eukprot:152497_1
MDYYGNYPARRGYADYAQVAQPRRGPAIVTDYVTRSYDRTPAPASRGSGYDYADTYRRAAAFTPKSRGGGRGRGGRGRGRGGGRGRGRGAGKLKRARDTNAKNSSPSKKRNVNAPGLVIPNLILLSGSPGTDHVRVGPPVDGTSNTVMRVGRRDYHFSVKFSLRSTTRDKALVEFEVTKDNLAYFQVFTVSDGDRETQLQVMKEVSESWAEKRAERADEVIEVEAPKPEEEATTEGEEATSPKESPKANILAHIAGETVEASSTETNGVSGDKAKNAQKPIEKLMSFERGLGKFREPYVFRAVAVLKDSPKIIKSAPTRMPADTLKDIRVMIFEFRADGTKNGVKPNKFLTEAVTDGPMKEFAAVADVWPEEGDGSVEAVSDGFSTEMREAFRVGLSPYECELCDDLIQHRSLTTHRESKCRNRLGKCYHCKEMVPMSQMTSPHHDTDCPEYPVKCANKCPTSIPRRTLDEHALVCPRTKVPCIFEEHGCEFKVMRSKMDGHCRDQCHKHTNMLLGKQLKLVERIVKLEETVNVLQ